MFGTHGTIHRKKNKRMTIYDWIVIGNGLTGAALSYELAMAGYSVLVLDGEQSQHNATGCSYGGIAYWSGSCPITKQLSQEGLTRHQVLSAELEADTEFCMINLLLTIPAALDPTAIAQGYDNLMIPPQLIDKKTACEMEPLLNPDAIAGALVAKHGHVNPIKIVQAYNQAFQRRGGTLVQESVQQLIGDRQRIEGVETASNSYRAANTVVCAGAMSRALLKSQGFSVPCYFTHAEMIITPPVDLSFQVAIMPADDKRLNLEGVSGDQQSDRRWDEPGQELAPPILDAGVFQFQDQSLRLGQISRTLTDPQAIVDAAASETAIRDAVTHIIPSLKSVPGTWHHCLVAFSGDRLPLVGAIPAVEGLHIFSGFGSPFAIMLPLAKRFAQASLNSATPDDILPQLSPSRFA